MHLGDARHRAPPNIRWQIFCLEERLAKRLDTPRRAGENAGANLVESGMERIAECHCGQLKAIATGEPAPPPTGD
jgi:hypothetical protein